MDIDPLGDTLPPRYAVESDEEEDEYNPLQSSKQVSVQLDIKIIGDLLKDRALIIATGDAARFWAQGAKLGEQCATVALNGVQVGLIFNPPWTKANVLISEVTTRLPTFAMHKYAENVIESLKPLSVSLLDSYPVPAYISSAPVAYYDAPIRYLSTTTPSSPLTQKAQPFSPPNLIQSTSAAFMSIVNLSHSKSTLILLPGLHIPPPPPKHIEPISTTVSSNDSLEWAEETVNLAQALLFSTIGEQPNNKWEHTSVRGSPRSLRNKGDIGEGSMYI